MDQVQHGEEDGGAADNGKPEGGAAAQERGDQEECDGGEGDQQAEDGPCAAQGTDSDNREDDDGTPEQQHFGALEVAKGVGVCAVGGGGFAHADFVANVQFRFAGLVTHY